MDLTPEQFERLGPYFDEAKNLPQPGREAVIERLRQAEGDEMAEELIRMLNAQDELTDTMDEPLVHLPRPGEPKEPRTFQDGEVILGRFRIVRLLGRGGMGEVYEAHDQELGPIALKTIRRDLVGDRSTLRRFKQEVQRARQVASPYVCRIHELFMLPENGMHTAAAFLTMELLAGVTLARRIARGPIPWNEALPIAINLCEGLEAIHAVGLVHRDFKPGNVMLTRRGNVTRPLVMDFGLAQRPEETGMTQTGVGVGTPGYIPPEQSEGGQVSPATDVYALGVVLYEMATGKRPFEASTPPAARRRPPAASSIQPGVPRRVDGVIEKCLDPEPANRFQAAGAVARALQPGAPPILAFWRTRRSAISLIGLAMLLALACTLWWFYATSAQTPGRQEQIAVLPFEDLSHDPVDQAFCVGLTDVLVGQLAELERFQGSLTVIPSSEVRNQKISGAQEAYRLWRVNLVVTGSVQRSSRSLRLIVNLIDAKTVKQLRSKTIQVPESEPDKMQNGVVSQVADLLDLQLRPQARRLLSAGTTTVPGAYDYYLQGYGYLREFSGLTTIDQAIEEFGRALSLDRSYALAHAGLGEAYWRKYRLTNDHSLLDEAWSSCRQALRLNDGIAAVHNTLGLLYLGAGDYQAALREYRRALNIDPYSRDAFSGLASVYEKTAKLGEAEDTFKQAIALRPDYWNGYVRLATFYTSHGRYEEAVAPLQKAIELVPDHPLPHTDLGGVYQYLGRNDLAEGQYNKSLEIRPTDSAYSDLASTYFYRSDFEKAALLYKRAVELSPATFDYWGNLGDAYRLQGDKTGAQHAYQKAIALCRESLKVNSADAIAMSSLASYLAKSGNREEAVEKALRAEKLAAGNSNVLYDVVLTRELAGQRKEAIAALKKATALGYSRAIVLEEPDLARLRADADFEEILKQ